MTPPILFLAFNRPDTTARVFDAIRAARPKRLYVAADGSRANRPDEAENCAEVRKIATTLDWPCEIKTLFRDRNLGCGNAVRTAIDWFFEHEEEGIILEDDCLPSPDFFRFCSELLERFRHEKRIMAICGSCYAEPHTSYGASYYFSYYSDPWGWATWRRAWRLYDRDWSRWCEFQARGGLKDISAGRLWHETYWSKCFEIGRKGEEHIWDYQWIYSVIEQGGLACYPVRNLISNIGRNVTMWSATSIGHHSIVEDDCFFAIGVTVSGLVTVGQSSFVGANVTIRDGVRIGKRCVIGAGAVVLEDIPDDSIVGGAGSPIWSIPSSQLRRI